MGDPSDSIPDVVAKLWDLGNLVAGFAVVQGMAFGYVTLQDYWSKKVLGSQGPYVLVSITVMIIFGMAVETYAVWWCHAKSFDIWAAPERLKDLFSSVVRARVVCVILFGLLSVLAAWGPVIDQRLGAKPNKPAAEGRGPYGGSG